MAIDTEFDTLAHMGKKIAGESCYDQNPGEVAAFNLGVIEYAKKHNISTDEVVRRLAEKVKWQIEREIVKNDQSINAKIKDFACKNNVRI